MDGANHGLMSGVEWHVASRAMPGEAVSGDAHVVVPFPNGVLVAVMDGLGHGEQAALAAKAAAAELINHNDRSLVNLLSACHRGLTATRGVAMNLACFNTLRGTVSWLGVGNVEGVILRDNPAGSAAREWLHQRPGIVGHEIPSLEASTVPLYPGDTLIFATDGIRSDFVETLTHARAPGKLASEILVRSGKDWDDALVLVARYSGSSQ